MNKVIPAAVVVVLGAGCLGATAAPRSCSVPDPSTLDVMLDNFQAQGYVVRDGDDVKSEMSFAKGAVTVNGKVLGAK